MRTNSFLTKNRSRIVFLIIQGYVESVYNFGSHCDGQRFELKIT